MKGSAIRAIMVLSFKEAIRAKWLISFGIVFFFLAINIPLLALVTSGYLGPEYVRSSLGLLVASSLGYLPLLALPIGSMSVVEDRESGILQYLLSNPISRTDFLLGRLLGLTAATSAVVVAGYGIAAIYAFHLDISGYTLLVLVILVAVLLNAATLAMALLVSVISKRKATALGLGIFLWFVMSILVSIGSLGVEISLTSNAALVMPFVLFNPVQTAYLLALLQLNLNNYDLGIGLAVKTVLGPNTNLILLISLISWILVLLLVSFVLFRKQDVN